MNAGDVLDTIERSFDSKAGWFLMREIHIHAHGSGRADAVALQTYASRGIHLHGFEVKVNRRDWQAELRNAAKADPLIERCRFFTVVAPQGVVEPADLPLGWGLSEVRGGRLWKVVQPEQREALPLDLYTVSLILRRCHGALLAPFRTVTQAKLDEAYQRGVSQGEKSVDVERYDRESHRRLIEAVEAFELASGIAMGARHLGPDRAERIGAAVRLVMQSPDVIARARQDLRRMAHGFTELAAQPEGEA